MNELIRTEKYKKTFYIDYFDEFILNYPKVTQLPDFMVKKPKIMGLITHLPGAPNNYRASFFKKYL
jgi:hypothetical protein